MPTAHLPTTVFLEDATALDMSDDRVAFPVMLNIRTSALPVSSSPNWNLTRALDENGLAWGLFALLVPGVLPMEQLTLLGHRVAAGASTGGGYTLLASSEGSGTEISANVTLRAETSICAFVQLLAVGSDSGMVGISQEQFQRSKIHCHAYTISSGVPLWVYKLLFAILMGLFMVVVIDDITCEIRDARAAKRLQAGLPTADNRGSLPAAPVVGDAHVGAIRVGLLPVHQRGRNDPYHDALCADHAAGAVWSRGQESTPSRSLSSPPATPVRLMYERACACLAALWDVTAFLVNILFVASTMAENPSLFLTWILVMVGVVIAALIVLAIRVHVALFSMPSRMAIRRRAEHSSAHNGNSNDGAVPPRHLAVGGDTRTWSQQQQRILDALEDVPEGMGASSQSNLSKRSAPGANRFEEQQRLSRLPLATHFWPFVAVYALAVDATAVEIAFTSRPRSFWFGLQRWVHDVPSLVVAVWFTVAFPRSTNAASVLQVFFSGSGVVFGYRGVIMALAVPLLMFVSRCCSSMGASNVELWIRERTGLLSAEATSPPHRHTSHLLAKRWVERASSFADNASQAASLTERTAPSRTNYGGKLDKEPPVVYSRLSTPPPNHGGPGSVGVGSDTPVRNPSASLRAATGDHLSACDNSDNDDGVETCICGGPPSSSLADDAPGVFCGGSTVPLPVVFVDGSNDEDRDDDDEGVSRGSQVTEL